VSLGRSAPGSAHICGEVGSQLPEIKDESASLGESVPPDRRATWQAPASAMRLVTAHGIPDGTADVTGGAPGSRVRGALGGSRIYEQPRHAAVRDALLRFAAGTDEALSPEAAAGPLAVEVGFDHGMVLLDHARAFPASRWLGLEVREARVLAVAEHAPSNCRVFKADARTIFAAVLPPASVDRVEVLFPTPWWDEAQRDRRLLLTAAFVADLARVVRPGGVVLVVTDVGPYFAHVVERFAGWVPAPEPPRVPTLSRRERVCRRDGLQVWRGCWSPPPG
jgi:tRNA G46 methylase TrmB